MSLDYLIDLANRTGDRLIVHNPIECQDVVIMSVQEYESLIDSRRSSGSMSSNQLLDQINRDISVWRSNREEDEEWDRSMQLEDELWDEEMEDFIPEPWDHSWYRAGDIMGDRYQPILNMSEASDYFDEDEDEDESDEIDWTPPKFVMDEFSPSSVSDKTDNVKVEDNKEDLGFLPFDDKFKHEIKVEDIPFDPPSLENLGEVDPANDALGWEEEPLPGDEPVFYEEPV
ncbi:hypothetical protein KJ641_02790 [Patescibacteria group bacterium]|nr:hypothetical protein [Patescibacteria group bacterium]MBU1895771.1 hypothetical protein [Patescibacteria group bacterium]